MTCLYCPCPPGLKAFGGAAALFVDVLGYLLQKQPALVFVMPDLHRALSLCQASGRTAISRCCMQAHLPVRHEGPHIMSHLIVFHADAICLQKAGLHLNQFQQQKAGLDGFQALRVTPCSTGD